MTDASDELKLEIMLKRWYWYMDEYARLESEWYHIRWWHFGRSWWNLHERAVLRHKFEAEMRALGVLK